jgi:hypothetical protein
VFYLYILSEVCDSSLYLKMSLSAIFNPVTLATGLIRVKTQNSKSAGDMETPKFAGFSSLRITVFIDDLNHFARFSRLTVPKFIDFICINMSVNSVFFSLDSAFKIDVGVYSV